MIRRTALVLLVLLAAQMAGAAAVSGGRCCPAMDDEAPCASLASFGCCETGGQGTVPDPVVAPTAGLPAAAIAPAAPALAPSAAYPPQAPPAAHRALRLTILRL